jgi:acyl-CoA synthetase (AMP-forming)/AMP-acid ligase II
MEQALDALLCAGFRRTSISFQYGMTESTSTVAQCQIGRLPRRHKFHSLYSQDIQFPLGYRTTPNFELLSSGKILSYHKVRIVSDQGHECADGELGNILISGPCVADFTNTTGIPSDRWTSDGEYKTGDIGLFSNGELFVHGRSDDLIIVDGVNVWPGDVEAIADSLKFSSGISFVAFGIDIDERSTQKLVLIGETTQLTEDRILLQLEISKAIREAIGVAPSAVIIKSSPFLERTASGKVDRRRTRDRVIESLLQELNL